MPTLQYRTHDARVDLPGDEPRGLDAGCAVAWSGRASAEVERGASESPLAAEVSVG